MKIGYARVSTEPQHLDLQRNALDQAGCVRIFEEKITGATNTRPALIAALESVGEGDMLIVWKLDRLGRSLQHLIEIIQQLEEKGAGFHSLSDNIDTTSAGGRLLFHIIGAIAEFERAQISERTKAGLAAARHNGKVLGRPRCISALQIEEARWLHKNDSLSLTEISHRLKIGRTTLWRILRYAFLRERWPVLPRPKAITTALFQRCRCLSHFPGVSVIQTEMTHRTIAGHPYEACFLYKAMGKLTS